MFFFLEDMFSDHRLDVLMTVEGKDEWLPITSFENVLVRRKPSLTKSIIEEEKSRIDAMHDQLTHAADMERDDPTINLRRPNVQDVVLCFSNTADDPAYRPINTLPHMPQRDNVTPKGE
jgi:hypothetical protein